MNRGLTRAQGRGPPFRVDSGKDHLLSLSHLALSPRPRAILIVRGLKVIISANISRMRRMTRRSPAKLDDLCDKFGARIRHLRLKLGLSQEELAGLCELDRTYIGGIERGERNPSLKNICIVASALGVHVSDLFEDSDAPSRALSGAAR